MERLMDKGREYRLLQEKMEQAEDDFRKEKRQTEQALDELYDERYHLLRQLQDMTEWTYQELRHFTDDISYYTELDSTAAQHQDDISWLYHREFQQLEDHLEDVEQQFAKQQQAYDEQWAELRKVEADAAERRN